MEIKIFAKTDNALQGLTNHYKDTRKIKNRLKLSAFGISHSMDAEKKVLIVNFNGLIKKILAKGGSFEGYKDQVKEDFLNDLEKSMHLVNATPKDYEVVFNDEY